MFKFWRNHAIKKQSQLETVTSENAPNKKKLLKAYEVTQINYTPDQVYKEAKLKKSRADYKRMAKNKD